MTADGPNPRIAAAAREWALSAPPMSDEARRRLAVLLAPRRLSRKDRAA